MRNVDQHLARGDLRLGQCLLDVVDRAYRHFHGVDAAHPFVGAVGQEMLRQDGNDFFAVDDAVGVAGEARIFRQVGQADAVAQGNKLAVVAAGNDEVTVGGAEHLVGHDVGVGIAVAARHLARCEVVHGLVGQRCHLHVQQCQVDMLAQPGFFAAQQRGLDGDGGVEAGHQVGKGNTGFLRPAAGQVVALAGNAHQSAEALDDEVVARLGRTRAGLAKAGDRAVHQPRVELRQ